ncbi:MAG: ABC transporter permease [Acidimicrobiales bacterium]
MSAVLRIVRQVGYSTRALFGWMNPIDYAILLLVDPGFQLYLFVIVGRFGPETQEFYLVGNSVRLMSVGAIFGATSVIVNERTQGTLTTLLATPTRLPETFWARSLFQSVSGLLTGVFCLVFGSSVFDVDTSNLSVPWVGVGLLAVVFSLAGFGLLLANLSLVGTDTTIVLNLASYGLILLSGANIAPEDLPGGLEYVSRLLPMTNGLQVVRAGFAGEADYACLAWELIVGLGYTVLGFSVFAVAETRARKTGKLELV